MPCHTLGLLSFFVLQNLQLVRDYREENSEARDLVLKKGRMNNPVSDDLLNDRLIQGTI